MNMLDSLDPATYEVSLRMENENKNEQGIQVGEQNFIFFKSRIAFGLH